MLRATFRSLAVHAVLASERWRSGVAYNPLSVRVAQDPYPVYRELRERDPVHRSRLMDTWLLTRYRDVDAVLRNHRQLSNNPYRRSSSSRRRNPPPPQEDLSMLLLDPPDHTRLRALVNKAFARQSVNALETRIRGLMGGLLDAIDDPAVFGQPERLDVRRSEGNHIAFGRGIHHCLGAFLARLESRIAFEMLLERFPTIRLLTGRPVFCSGIVLRGLESLPLGTGR